MGQDRRDSEIKEGHLKRPGFRWLHMASGLQDQNGRHKEAVERTRLNSDSLSGCQAEVPACLCLSMSL